MMNDKDINSFLYFGFTMGNLRENKNLNMLENLVHRKYSTDKVSHGVDIFHSLFSNYDKSKHLWCH